jgi:hypothetical protein
MLPNASAVNANPRKISCKLEIGSDTITNVKMLTYSSDWSGNITVGQVVSSYISATLPTPSFSLAGVNVTLSMGIGDPVNWVQIGIFRVDEESIQTKQGYTSFNAYDKLYSAINTYHTSLTYPDPPAGIPLQSIYAEVCRQIGLTSYPNLTYNPSFQADSEVLEMLDGYTLRDVLGFIAAYQGKNAYLSPAGALEFRWFTASGYTADGTRANVPYIGENNSTVGRLICQTANGVLTTGSGEGIYFTCPFMDSTRLSGMLSSLSLTYRKADVDIPYGNFCLQSGDIITVTTVQNQTLSVPIMNNSWTYDGGLSSTVAAYDVSDYSGTANNAERSLSVRRVQRQMAVNRATSDLKAASEKITGASGGYIRINFGGDGKTAALLIMDTEDISTAQNVWVFNQEGLGHFPNGYDPTAQANVALTADGWVAASRISGEMISGVGIENVDNALTTKPKIALANGCIHFTETYSYDGQTEQVTDIGKMEYLPRSGQNNPATIALTCLYGNNISIGEYGYPKYVYRSQPTGTDKMHHFYGDVKFFDGVYIGDAPITADILAHIVDNTPKNVYNLDLDTIKSLNTSGSWNGNVYSIGNATFTIYDEYIVLNGYGQLNLFLCDYIPVDNGNWVISGCPPGGADNKYYIAANTINWNSKDYGDGKTVYVANNKIKMAITLMSSTPVSDVIFSPMICKEELWNISHRYVPWCPTNRELYNMIKNL